MRQERFVNNAQTTLSGTITSGATNLNVADGSAFPSEGDFRIVIESELILVTHRTGNTLTIVRGIENTTPAEHTTGVDVKAVLTSAAIDQWKQDFPALYVAGQTPPCRMFDDNEDIIDVSDFTWANQGTSAAVDQDGGIKLTIPGSTRQMRVLYRTAPATPYTVDMAFYLGSISLDAQLAGGFTVGDGTKWSNLSYYPVDYKLAMVDWPSATGTPAAGADSGQIMIPPMIWIKFTDDGANHTYSWSPDGGNWQVVHSQSRTDYLSGGGDRVGFFMDNGGDTDSHGFFGMLKHWSGA